METEQVFKILIFNSVLFQLITQGDCNALIHRDSFKLYMPYISFLVVSQIKISSV